MRTIKYLSPTSLSKYLESADDFYLSYLADVRPPRSAQTRPMSIGSAFDAHAKSYIHEKLFGKNHKDSNKFSLDALFEAQVEQHNRDWARHHGNYVFKNYVSSGAFSDLFMDLQHAIGEPRFELDMEGTVQNDINSVPFLGKPDVFFTNSQGLNIISDWKVNGYCSKTGASPTRGFVKRIPKFDCHKDAMPTRYRGTTINTNGRLQDIDSSWARQTTIYGWLCGCEVGSDFVHAIDQVACSNRHNPQPGVGYPQLSFVQHRYQAQSEYQFETFKTASTVWEIVSGPKEKYFPGLSDQESKDRCDILEAQAKRMYDGPQNEEEATFRSLLGAY